MSFSYNAANDTTLNRVRLLFSDTDSTNYLFSDEEINLFVNIYGTDIHLIASAMCKAVASNKALGAKYFALHNQDLQIDLRSIPRFFIDLANMYEKTGSTSSITEYVDSIHYSIDKFGRETDSEFEGDDELY